MRRHFPHHDAPDDAELERFIRTATIVPDTNVLTALYRLSKPARDEALAVLKVLADDARLWIPYQVGDEFFRNRLGVIDELPGAYGKVLAAANGLRKAASDAFGAGESRFRESRDAVQREIDASVERLTYKIEELRDGDVSVVQSDGDPILDALDRMLDGQVGEPLPPDEHRAALIEFHEHRLPMQIPPGYEDGKKGGVRAAGDYILWLQVLRHAERSGRPLMLVTDDTKGDWYQPKQSGKTAGPRLELVVEFGTRSPHGYRQLTFQRFLKISAQHLNISVDDDTLVEVEEDSRARERGRDDDIVMERLKQLVAQSRAAKAAEGLADLVYREDGTLVRFEFNEDNKRRWVKPKNEDIIQRELGQEE